MSWVSFYITNSTDLSYLKSVLGTQWKSGTVKKRLAKAALEATKKYVRVDSGALQKSGFANTAGRMVFPKDYASTWWDEPVQEWHSPNNDDAIQSPHTHDDVTAAVCEEAADILEEYF